MSVPEIYPSKIQRCTLQVVQLPFRHSREGGNPGRSRCAPRNVELDSRLRPPWMEVILGMQAGECSLQRRHFQHPCWSEQFPVRGNDG
jgi:hypothetical protein